MGSGNGDKEDSEKVDSNKVKSSNGDEEDSKKADSDKVGPSNKDKEDSEKVNNKDNEKTGIDKEMTNPPNTKPKPPKAKFQIKNVTRAKLKPDTECTASIAVEAKGSRVKEIVIAKNTNSNWN